MEKDIINEFKDIVEESRTEDNTEYYIKLRNTLDLLENIIARNKELEEISKEQANKIEDYEDYMRVSMIPKSKVREIFERNIKKETYFGATGYSFTLEGCQALAREIKQLLQEGDK